ncbi:hypothetical protein ACEN2J_14215 [Pseudorhodobacter sp. W20_MBD10_FR17]
MKPPHASAKNSLVLQGGALVAHQAGAYSALSNLTLGLGDAVHDYLA